MTGLRVESGASSQRRGEKKASQPFFLLVHPGFRCLNNLACFTMRFSDILLHLVAAMTNQMSRKRQMCTVLWLPYIQKARDTALQDIGPRRGISRSVGQQESDQSRAERDSRLFWHHLKGYINKYLVRRQLTKAAEALASVDC